MQNKISRSHTNRHAHNWLLYDVMEKFLLKNKDCFHGQLYDLGCGESPYRDFFLSLKCNYVGVDWTNTVHKGNATVIADLNVSLPLADNSADCVVAISVLEHLYHPQNMLKEAHRILRPGNALVLQVPWQWWTHEMPHDYFRYSKYGMKFLLEEAGFRDITIEAQTGFFTTLIMKFNYFTRRWTKKGIVGSILKVILVPVWFFGQILAPALDKLDSNWELETYGFFIVARK